MKQKPSDSGLKEFQKKALHPKARPAPVRLWPAQPSEPGRPGREARERCVLPSRLCLCRPCRFSAAACWHPATLVGSTEPHGTCPHPACLSNPSLSLCCSHQGLRAVLAVSGWGRSGPDHTVGTFALPGRSFPDRRPLGSLPHLLHHLPKCHSLNEASLSTHPPAPTPGIPKSPRPILVFLVLPNTSHLTYCITYSLDVSRHLPGVLHV